MREKKNWRRYCARPENALAANRAELLQDGEAAFPAMLSAIAGARTFVLLEFYAFADDSIGRAFADLLKEKAREGVAVHLIYDSVGSILTDRDFFLDLAAAGVKVAEYRPVIFWKPYWNWIKRDHRKTVCIDGKAALVGGFNITEYDAPRSMGGRGWRDTQALLRGPAVAELEKIFWEAWAASTPVIGAKPAPRPVSFPGPAGDTVVSVLSAGGIRNVRSIRRSYRYAIDRAVDYIYITNAYFLPDRLVYRRLIKAARRGVDVRVISPRDTDHPYVRWASWAMYAHMIKNGVKIYEWQGQILHSKTAVIDGTWSSVGSHNLDHRSLHYNLEVNLNVYDAAFGAGMARVFREDLKLSKLVTMEDVRNRPFTSKAASKLLYLFRSWL
ncbi:MAG: hypothetical protein A2X35_04515 [Elusimicrobia bacterium GWA2_61_42]|nr:MAG: hypothetical protein A2X35_04515 [Elusimicrobia bacterium GWA2_61_42]OGR76604.1 MAG: hypothetical protein A2X38_03430 [Elusimicrobia bacterium GWC2_61_25]